MEPRHQQTSLITPIAIVVGFGMVALAVYFSGIGSSSPSLPQKETGNATATMRPVDSTDFIRGNPNAPITIVEYSDYDCPFCQEFHQTMTQIMNEFGASGKVAWVYRQYPIAALHPNSPKLSEAALCVGDLIGNDGFWRFSDVLFSSREVNQLTNMSNLAEYATAAGADSQAFTTCLNTGKMTETVKNAGAEALAMGLEGTPHSILLVGNQQAVIEGAESYATVREIVDNLINQLEGKNPTPPLTSTSTPN